MKLKINIYYNESQYPEKPKRNIYTKSNNHGLHPKDIDFMRKKNQCTEEKSKQLLKEKDIYDDPSICIIHRRYQEILREKYNYYSDQESWDKNNNFLHNFEPEK